VGNEGLPDLWQPLDLPGLAVDEFIRIFYKVSMKLTALMKIRFAILAITAALFVSGCVSTDLDYDLILSGEAKKVRSIQIGMTISQVENMMGTEQMEISDRRHVYYTPRPAKTDRFKGKDGKAIDIFYYRTSAGSRTGTSRSLAAFSDDDLTAVFFIEGKVDAVMSGGSAKSVIEVRVR